MASFLGRVYDVCCFASALEDHPEWWSEITSRQDYKESSHKDTQTVYLRMSEDTSVYGAYENRNCVDFPKYDLFHEVRDIVADMASLVGATDIGRVMFVRLLPWGRVAPHSDEGLYAEYYKRYHIPVKTSEGCLFVDIEGAHNMKVGELWTFPHRYQHSVYNSSLEDRIHLIVDMI